jgi:hypothetical protein
VFWVWFLIFVFAGSEICRRIFTPKRAAREIVENSKALYSAPHEFAEIRASDFRDLDHQFYNRAQAELEAFGFRHVADIEDLTVSRQMPAMRTFVRILIGDHRSTSAAIYHLKFRRFYRLLQLIRVLPQKPFFIDLESEFSDGTFLATSNTRGTDLSGDVPGIQRQTFPAETPIGQLMAAHREEFGRQCQEGRTATKVGCLAEVRAAQHRMQEAKNRHKQTLGHVDGEQTARVAAMFNDTEANHELALELRALRAQNLAASGSAADTPATSGR